MEDSNSTVAGRQGAGKGPDFDQKSTQDLQVFGEGAEAGGGQFRRFGGLDFSSSTVG